jgi:integrase
LAATLTTGEIDDWLGSLEMAGLTRNNIRKEVVGLFNFAVKRHFAEFNPAIATERVKDAGGEVGILTPDELRVLLEVSAPDVLPFFALGAFAGLRVVEIKRLDWSAVNLASGFIMVGADTSKTRQRRLVKIEPNLAAWLAPYAQKRGSVCGANHRKNMEAARRAAVEKARELRMNAPGLEEWPDNAARHSYGSYWLATHKNANELALLMGNSVEMIFRHYREVVAPSEADRYWSIMPAQEGAKIVALNEAAA